ncbi:MAG: SIMPL domain-containing protein [Candidatus Paceibacterota bacterium]
MNEGNTHSLWQILKGNEGVKNLTLVILILVALLLVGKVFAEFKTLSFIGQSADVRNTITVRGEGELSLVPDVAQFNFAVIHEAKEVANAQEQVSKDIDTLLSYLDEFGVANKDIKTTSYTISPRYDYREVGMYPGGTRVLVGYEVSQWIEIKLKNIDALGELVSGLGSRGATNIGSIRFTVEDEEKVLRDARKLAIDDAKEKARVLARDLGVSLVGVVNFYEGGGIIADEEKYTLSLNARGRGESFEAQLPVGEEEIKVNVSITYSIR